MQRRKFVEASLSCLAGSGFLGSALSSPVGADTFMFFYRDSLTNLNLPVADCKKIENLITDAKNLRSGLSNPKIIDELISQQIIASNRLKAENRQLRASIDKLNREILLSRVSSVVSAIFLVSGLVVASPTLIATSLAVQVVGGSAILALQILYGRSETTSLILGYSKDRSIFFGEAIAERSGSSGGKILARSISIVSLALDIFSLSNKILDLDKSKAKLSSLMLETEALEKLLTRYPPSERAAWGAIFDVNLEGTILQLERFRNEYQERNCLIRPPDGPSVRKP